MIYTRKFNTPERIINHLMLHSYFLPDISLLNGQMGIILSMAEYYRKTGNKAIYNFMDSLLDNMIEKINKKQNYTFGSGIAGVGWGIEFLIQNNLVDGIGIEICADIDREIMRNDPKRIYDLSLESGFEGLLNFIIYHIQGSIKQQMELPFDTPYLSDIRIVCKNIVNNNISESLKKNIKMYNYFYESGIMTDYHFKIKNLVKTDHLPGDLNNISMYRLGLSDGLAGVLLNYIDKDIM